MARRKRKPEWWAVMLVEALVVLFVISQLNKRKKAQRIKRYVHQFDRPAKWRNGRQRKLKLW